MAGELILGTRWADDLEGGDGDDTINGMANEDTIVGGGGDDSLSGGGWDDLIEDFAGDNTLIGGGGRDELWGYEGDQLILGGRGDDQLGGDTHGSHRIELRGEHGSDVLWGVAESITAEVHVFGGPGADLMIGSRSRVVARGGSGDDVLNGSELADNLHGGSGDDYCIGYLGSNTLTGGAGSDRFLFSRHDLDEPEFKRDHIRDFESGIDRILLSERELDEPSDTFRFIGTQAFSGIAGDVRAHARHGLTHLKVDYDGNGDADLHVVLRGAPELTAADLEFLV